MQVVAACDRLGVLLPTPKGPAAGGVFMNHRREDGSCDLRAVVQELAQAHGTAKAQAQAKAANAAACLIPTNAPIAAMFDEMGSLMRKAGEPGFKLTSYFPAAASIRGWETPITTGKVLCSGKTKVKGLGKSTGQKIDEFLETGTCAKLEKLRQQAAGL